MITGRVCDALFIITPTEDGARAQCWSRGHLMAEEVFPSVRKAVSRCSRVFQPLVVTWDRTTQDALTA